MKISHELLLAHNLLYYVYTAPILTDVQYDKFEKTVFKRLGISAKSDLEDVELKSSLGSDKLEDYPPQVRALALYLSLRFAQKARKVKKKGLSRQVKKKGVIRRNMLGS